jgi:hypothetical protein
MLTTINAPLTLKPAASKLLNGEDERGREYPVLSVQKFGRGRAMAFPVQDSWNWQMHASIPVEDQTHERFWRQMLRLLVEGVPGTVDIHTTERVEPGEPVTVEASVADPSFIDVNDAVVGHRLRAGGAGRLGVFRPDDARRAAAAYRGGDRRTVLYG